jgi:transcription elongation factor Elf1
LDNKTQERIRRFQKRMNCSLHDCGQTVTLSATKDYLESVEEEKQVFHAKCSKCGSAFKIKKRELDFFGRYFGEPKLEVKSTTFDDLFE